MLAFNDDRDFDNRYRVAEHSAAGVCWVDIYKESVDLNKGYICGIPIIDKSSYKKPRVFFSDSNISVMHGSKRGIQATHGNRVSEYDYYFSRWLGKRFAKYVKRTGKKILVIKTSKEATCRHGNYQNICNLEFQCGFDSVFGGRDLRTSIDQKWCNNDNYNGLDDRHLENPKCLVFSDLYLSCHEQELEIEIASKAYSIIEDLARIDMLEKQTKTITKGEE